MVGDLEVERFFPDWLDDEFDQFSLTINGRLGALDLVYAGSFLDREVNNSFDYSGYTAVGAFGAFYICDYTTYYTTGFYGTCGDPTQGMIAHIENERTTHELRLSYDEGGAFDLVAGIFLDDVQAKVDTNFFVAGSIGHFAPNSPISTSTIFNPNPRPEGITFINDATRDEEQFAAFGELTFNATDTLSFTIGARYYDIETSLVGSSNWAFACVWAEAPCGPDVDDDAGVNYDAIFESLLPLEESDTILKANVSYQPNDDLLFFVTWSEGFRPGGFNRNDQLTEDRRVFVSDEVTNFEFGWKTTLADGSVRFNGSIYQIDWDALQVGVTDFENFGVLTFVLNVGNAEIRGFEGDLAWLASDQLTLSAAWSINNTELTSVPDFVTNLAPEGSDLALAPKLQYNIRGRYEWDVGERIAHAQLVLAHTDSQFSSVIAANRFEQDSYDTLDGAIGLTTDDWSVELFAENLTDERAELFINALDTDLRITTNRPRTWGIRVSYDF